jgi:hypothetical protein
MVKVGSFYNEQDLDVPDTKSTPDLGPAKRDYIGDHSSCFYARHLCGKEGGGVRVLTDRNEQRTRNDSHAPHPFEFCSRTVLLV